MFQIDAAVQIVNGLPEVMTIQKLPEPYNNDVPSFFVDMNDEMGILVSELPKEEGLFRFKIRVEEEYDSDTGFNNIDYYVVSFKKLRVEIDEVL